MAKFDSYQQGTPSWVEHSSSDPQASKEFYGQLFGWDFEDNPMTDDAGNDLGVYSIAKLDDDRIAGLGPVMDQAQPSSWGVYLASDDVDAAVLKAQGAGGKVLAPPMDVPDQGRMAWVTDPSGAAIGLWQEKGFAGTQRANEPGTPIWNELVTPDIDAVTPFYADTVGLRAQTDPMGDDGGTYTGFYVGEAMKCGAMPPQQEGTPPHWNVYFNVDDTDATVARAKELGGTAIAQPFDVPGVGRLAVLQDPQGAMFNLMQNPSE